MPAAGRKRGRYSDEFKRKVVGACRKPGVSTAAIALANGLNANLLRRWMTESEQLDKASAKKPTSLAPLQAAPAFIPVQLEHAGGGADIRIELQQGATTIRIQWPASASSACAAWMREVLK
jgi:hypothetical protein